MEIQTINENGDILSSPLWYNPLISEHEVYFPSWNKGIVTVGDIVDNRGAVLEQKDIQKKFNFLNVNFLEYHRIKTLVNNFVKKYKNEDMFTHPQPCILKTLPDLHFNTTGTKGIYNELNKVNIEKDFQRKWHQDIGIIISRRPIGPVREIIKCPVSVRASVTFLQKPFYLLKY